MYIDKRQLYYVDKECEVYARNIEELGEALDGVDDYPTYLGLAGETSVQQEVLEEKWGNVVKIVLPKDMIDSSDSPNDGQ